jgi:hypothetical protein
VILGEDDGEPVRQLVHLERQRGRGGESGDDE